MKLAKINSKKVLIILALIAVAAILSAYFITQIIRTGRGMRYESDMSTLNSSISEALREYYKKNGRYPENLELLRESILSRIYISKIFEEYKGINLLDKFKYSTDGSSYIMTLDVGRHTYKEEGQKGELARSELYINGKLLEKNQK